MQQLHYQQRGKGDNVILIHGLFGSLENLNMVARYLSQFYCVTSVDVRNHGSSFHQNSMSYAELAQDVVNVMDFLSIESAYILGHSMGGKIAMQLAFSHPERVTKLIVADIAPVAYPPHHTRIIEGLRALDLSKVNKRSDADEQLAHYVDNKGVRQFLLRNLTRENDHFIFKCNLEYIDNCYQQIMQGFDGATPYNGATLFIKGGDSDYIQLSHKTIIEQLLPQSKVKIIQGAGHWLHAEKSTAFNKIAHDFINN